MTQLRMTPTPPFAPRPAGRPGVRFLLGLSALFAAGVGCTRVPDGPTPSPDAAVAPPVPPEPVAKPAQLPPPQPDRIEYDPETRTLTLYALPAPARWMVHLQGSTVATHVGPKHRLPGDVDPGQTYVCYSVPGGVHSNYVSVRSIQAAQEAHASTFRPR